MEFDLLKGKFTVEEARQLNPLVLALIGDTVFQTFVINYLVDKNREMSAHKLHMKAVELVKAHAQSEFMKILDSHLSEEEKAVFKRGRNTKSVTVPKNADVRDYRRATGFEALIGFLYITENKDRLNYILALISKKYEGKDVNMEEKIEDNQF